MYIRVEKHGHTVDGHREQVGRNPIGGRPRYGYSLRCDCGYRDHARAAPSATTPKRHGEHRARVHLDTAHTDQGEP